MKETSVTSIVVVDCEQCLKEEQMEVRGGAVDALPEGWHEVREGQPFNNTYQFCSTDCFVAWHERDKYERLTAYHDRLRQRQADIDAAMRSIQR